MYKRIFCCVSALFLMFLTGCGEDEVPRAENPAYRHWRSYLGDPGRSHFSTLEAFSPENVSQLQIAWEYESADFGQMQMSPIVIDSVLYGVSAALRAFALDARSGEELWVFGDSLKVWHSTSRGLSYWESGDDRRILYTIGSDLWALDAATGRPIPTFGEGGKIDLRSGLPESARDKFVISNTPGTIYKDLIIMPLRVSEGAGAAAGDIMAFDVRTGAIKWVFHTLPELEEAGSDTWGDPNIRNNPVVGAANNWAGMALDAEREILYVPTGSAAPDFYGWFRPGENLYSNCLLALDANTGNLLWYYQLTHHDIWDRDPPAPPNLITVKRNGKQVPAVAQVTKQGYVYVFDRETGAPLFDIKEVPVPASELEGEQTWPTQPIPVKPAPFARQASDLSDADVSPYAQNRDSLLAILKGSDRRLYAPPGLGKPVLLLPGYDGAAEWGGAGADPENGILYINSNEMAWVMEMRATAEGGQLSAGERTYRLYCAACHRTDRKGVAASGFPSLLDLGQKFTADSLEKQIRNGKGMMPGFPQLEDVAVESLIGFLFEEEDKREVTSDDPELTIPLPYQHGGYNKFLDAAGLPAISPPWGTLHALDLNSGEYLWQVTLGETDSLKALGHPQTGTENYGGPVITENGLLFLAATKDGYFRAFDRHSGALLWEYKLPAAAFATPALYEVDGKQYIALACGGEKLGTPKGNKIIAFSLEDYESKD